MPAQCGGQTPPSPVTALVESMTSKLNGFVVPLIGGLMLCGGCGSQRDPTEHAIEILSKKVVLAFIAADDSEVKFSSPLRVHLISGNHYEVEGEVRVSGQRIPFRTSVTVVPEGQLVTVRTMHFSDELIVSQNISNDGYTNWPNLVKPPPIKINWLNPGEMDECLKSTVTELLDEQ